MSACLLDLLLGYSLHAHSSAPAIGVVSILIFPPPPSSLSGLCAPVCPVHALCAASDVQLREIEERKNKHINELLSKHRAAFAEAKRFYNEVTRSNLAMIRSLKVAARAPPFPLSRV